MKKLLALLLALLVAGPAAAQIGQPGVTPPTPLAWSAGLAKDSDAEPVSQASLTYDSGIPGVHVGNLYVRDGPGSATTFWSKIPFSIYSGTSSFGNAQAYGGSTVGVSPPAPGSISVWIQSGMASFYPMQWAVEWLQGGLQFSPAWFGAAHMTVSGCEGGSVKTRYCEAVAGVPIRATVVCSPHPKTFDTLLSPGTYRFDAQYWDARLWQKVSAITVTAGQTTNSSVTVNAFLEEDLDTLACGVP